MTDDIVKRLRNGVRVSPMGNILTAEAELTMEKAADEIEKLRAVNADERIHFDTLYADFKSLRAENEKLLANLQVLADAVRVAKDAASYNRHKNEHCVSRSIWSALSDQEKFARKVLSDLRAAKAALGEK